MTLASTLMHSFSTRFLLGFCLTVSMLYTALAQNLEADLATLLTSEFSSIEPGVVALVAKKGEILLHSAVGMADLEGEVKLNKDHVFRIGSITKQFAAVAILQLAEEGKISLSDNVQKYVADFPHYDSPVTIQHLLTHTSGIKNYTDIENWNPPNRDLTSREIADLFVAEPLAFAPGESFSYTNLGYVMLGHIIEVVSGVSFAEYVEHHFFAPLNMNQSAYDAPGKFGNDRASGYSKKNNQYEEAEYLNMTLPQAAGGLVSSVTDLLTWYQALFDHQIITVASMEQAFSPYELNNGHLSAYGYGWEIGNIKGRKSIKHAGRISGFITYVIYLPAEEIFVALFTNCDCYENIETPASKIAAMTLGDPFESNQTTMTEKDLKPYLGVYRSPDGQKRIISLQDQVLMIHDEGGSKTTLFPAANGEFRLGETLATLAFNTKNENTVESFFFNALGLPTLWKRISGDSQTFQSIQLDDEALQKYLGKYKVQDAFVFEVIKEGEIIYGQVGNDRHQILPYDDHKFFAADIDAELTFDLNDHQEVIGLTMMQNREMKAVKIIE